MLIVRPSHASGTTTPVAFASFNAARNSATLIFNCTFVGEITPTCCGLSDFGNRGVNPDRVVASVRLLTTSASGSGSAKICRNEPGTRSMSWESTRITSKRLSAVWAIEGTGEISHKRHKKHMRGNKLEI